jgi:hypothetical protein
VTEIFTLVAATIASAVVVWRVGIQLFNDPRSIDPWLYTSLMTNFDVAYGWFDQTYYAARLPMILPGLALNSFLSPVAAYVVLHVVFLLGGAAFLYLLVRTLFGVRVALVTYPVFLLNVACLASHTWDYFDGFVITYLAGGLYFMLSSIPRRSRWRLGFSGACLAAAVATNVFVALLVAGGAFVYLYSRVRTKGFPTLRAFCADAAAFLAGFGLLVVGCGAFARAHGGPFLFFMPSIDTALTLKPGSGKLPDYSWVPAEPRLLLPPFVAALIALTWKLRPQVPRNAVGPPLGAATLTIFLLLVYLELERSRTLLQLPYYFATLYPLLFATLTAGIYALVESAGGLRRVPPYALGAIGVVLGCVPLCAVYGLDGAALWGRRGAAVTAVVLGGALVAALVVRLRPRRRIAATAAPLGAALALVGVNYASAASAMTHDAFETEGSAVASADETFRVGMKLVGFMKANDLEKTLPAFWYDASQHPELAGIQSLYFYAYSYLNRRMPMIDEEFRSQVERLEPTHVVLLCSEPTCHDGPAAMDDAGYHPREIASTRLTSGAISVWVEAYAVGPSPW